MDENSGARAVRTALELIGGKWKLLILWQLLSSIRRFGELKRLIPDISQRMLTRQLRELEEDGLLTRKVYAEVPPRVEYNLSRRGKTLEPLLRLICKWGGEQGIKK